LPVVGLFFQVVGQQPRRGDDIFMIKGFKVESSFFE
jgi:hypothetical protein